MLFQEHRAKKGQHPLMPFMVAEISGNHNGSLERAIDIVDAVALSGAHAVKIQTYTPESITLNVDSPAFRVSDNHALWASRTLYELYKEAHTPYEWHETIFSRIREHGLTAFSTPFDEAAVDFLEELDVELYKIASLEIVDLPLIRHAARTGKPLILSVGTARVSEIASAVDAARSGGCENLTLLVCTSSYPARPDDANLHRMATLADMFGVSVGLSDHTLGSGVAIAATALGATVIEKHVTLSRSDGGVDSAFSMEAEEFSRLVDDCDTAARSLGSSTQWTSSAENESIRLRPSLYVSESVTQGERVTADNVRSVRPSGGLEPELFETILGKQFTRDAQAGTPTSWELFTS